MFLCGERLCPVCVNACEGWKRVSYLLELELNVVGSQLVQMLRAEFNSSGRVEPADNHLLNHLSRLMYASCFINL